MRFESSLDWIKKKRMQAPHRTLNQFFHRLNWLYSLATLDKNRIRFCAGRVIPRYHFHVRRCTLTWLRGNKRDLDSHKGVWWEMNKTEEDEKVDWSPGPHDNTHASKWPFSLKITVDTICNYGSASKWPLLPFRQRNGSLESDEFSGSKAREAGAPDDSEKGRFVILNGSRSVSVASVEWTAV